MSYDLYLEPRGAQKLDAAVFEQYFSGRRHYQVGEGQAIYQNENTGVYFIFDAPQEGAVAFNLNFFRPHVFGLEASVELEEFCRTFEAVVHDAQGEMEDEAPFSRDAFLQGWNNGNLFGYRAMLKEQTEPVYTWPARRIWEVWAWNYTLPENEDRTVDGMFVPSIFTMGENGQAVSCAIWPPGCPILLPTVDFLLVPLVQDDPESQEMAIVPWAEVLPVVSAYEEKTDGLTRYRLGFEEWPAEIAEFLNRKREPVGDLNGIGLDTVLDEELVRQATEN